jgi:phage terminase large subunit-like protein
MARPSKRSPEVVDEIAQAQAVLAGDAKHLMLFGGSRSGKTFLLVRNVVMRALKAPNSRHAIFRYRFNSVKASVIADTFPKVMRLAFPGVPTRWTRPTGTRRCRTARRSGSAASTTRSAPRRSSGWSSSTIYFNECSQIPTRAATWRSPAWRRAGRPGDRGRAPSPLKPRVYYDENPPSKAHWTYKLFIQKLDPETRLPLAKPATTPGSRSTPRTTPRTSPADYLDTLNAMSARLRKRFRDGEFGDATPGALFTDEIIEKWRVIDGDLPEFVRVVVASTRPAPATSTTPTTTRSASWWPGSGRTATPTSWRTAP